MKKKGLRQPRTNKNKQEMWVRPGMSVTFRAEIMPGRGALERTFLVEQMLSGDRVRLVGLRGEHKETEFEPLRFGGR